MADRGWRTAAADKSRVMCALRVPSAIAILATLLPGVAAHTPDSGVVTGRVVLAGRIRGVPLPSNAYQPRSVNPRGGASLPEIRNVVVYLKDAVYSGALPTTRTQIRQTNESFTPRMVVITRGSTIDFPNGDPMFHNVFSLSPAATFDLGRF